MIQLFMLKDFFFFFLQIVFGKSLNSYFLLSHPDFARVTDPGK